MSDTTREQELLFAKTLEGVIKRARAQNQVVSEEQVRKAFETLELSEEQLQMVFDYLKKHKIGIGEPVDLDEYLTEDDLDYLEMYLQDLSGLSEVSEGEKQAIILSAMAGDRDAKKRLIEIFLPEVVEVAKLYAGQGVFMEDLIGEGNMALTLGVEMLGCLETAEEAAGMLGKMMMDAMEDFIGEAGEEDEGGKELAERAEKLYGQAKELSESLLRKVTVEELSRETGVTEDEILDMLQVMGGSMDYIEGTENGKQQ
ncbi:MAG: hypothetical protein J6B10_08760 [Lachnospiraceae bacterium]|nr:hypothetical protein [Lachnospiraceae bacterium]